MAWTESARKLAAALTRHEPSLYPDEEKDELDDIRIGKLAADRLTGADRDHALAVQAGLHLFNESLERARLVLEQLDTSTGKYWMGVMYRMEGDYDSARECFGEAGEHPVFATLGGLAAECIRSADLTQVANAGLRERLRLSGSLPDWDPNRFTELVEHQITMVRDRRAEVLLRHIQWMEMTKLLQYGFERIGDGGAIT